MKATFKYFSLLWLASTISTIVQPSCGTSLAPLCDLSSDCEQPGYCEINPTAAANNTTNNNKNDTNFNNTVFNNTDSNNTNTSDVDDDGNQNIVNAGFCVGCGFCNTAGHTAGTVEGLRCTQQCNQSPDSTLTSKPIDVSTYQVFNNTYEDPTNASNAMLQIVVPLFAFLLFFSFALCAVYRPVDCRELYADLKQQCCICFRYNPISDPQEDRLRIEERVLQRQQIQLNELLGRPLSHEPTELRLPNAVAVGNFNNNLPAELILINDDHQDDVALDVELNEFNHEGPIHEGIVTEVGIEVEINPEDRPQQLLESDELLPHNSESSI